MRGRTLVAALVLCGASGGPFQAVAAELGHWSVLRLPRSCTAVNRPLAEFNVFPANALALIRRDGTEETELQVWFWPDYLGSAASAKLLLADAKGRQSITVRPLEHAADRAVHARLSGDDGAWAPLLGGDTVSLGLAERSEALIFDVSHLPAVLAALDACADAL